MIYSVYKREGRIVSFSSNHYRDKEKYREVRERWKSRYRVRTGAYKWFSRWRDEDIRRVMEHSIPDRELSKEIEHSVSAIQKKRWEMNRKDA